MRTLSLKKYHKKVAGSSKDPCVFCSAPAVTIDHITPLSKGGHMRDLQNLAPMCYKCNNNKGDLSILLALATHPQLKRRIKYNIQTFNNQTKRRKNAAVA